MFLQWHCSKEGKENRNFIVKMQHPLDIVTSSLLAPDEHSACFRVSKRTRNDVWKAPGLHQTFVVDTVERQKSRANIWNKTKGKTWGSSSLGQPAFSWRSWLFTWLKARHCSLSACRACGHTDTLATLQHARLPENNIIDAQSDMHAHRCNWSLWAPPLLYL